MTLRTIPADEISVPDAFAAFTGKPRKTAAEKARDAELAQAYADFTQAILKAPRGPDAFRHDNQCRETYAARIREIEERYAEVLTECLGDPMLAKRRVA